MQMKKGNMTAKEIVLKQIEAFNRCQLEECLSYVSDDIQVNTIPSGEILFSGKTVLREHLEKSFADENFEEAEVLEIIEMNNLVVTKEKKVARKTKESRLLLITYFVENGQIAKMWGGRSEG